MAPDGVGVQEVGDAGGLPRHARVRKRRDFRTIQSSGRRTVTPGFILVVRARKIDGPAAARLGITASRRVGNAVVRNRAKRLVREAFRRTRDLWPPDVDLVVIVRGPTASRRVQDVVDEWRSSQHKIARQIAAARKDREKADSELADRSQRKQTRPPTP